MYHLKGYINVKVSIQVVCFLLAVFLLYIGFWLLEVASIGLCLMCKPSSLSSPAFQAEVKNNKSFSGSVITLYQKSSNPVLHLFLCTVLSVLEYWRVKD